MTVTLSKRADINLDSGLRVAWQQEGVAISEAAMAEIARCRAAFLQLIDTDPSVMIYGVTTAMGELASTRLTHEERDRHARIKAFAAATSFGDPFPDRVVRAFALARLANFIEGNAATTPRMALAVADMLDGRPLPRVASSGQGGAGEILALYPLFADLTARFDLEVKERGSLINGSPCAAALLADAALAARRRLRLIEQVFALSIEAFRAPLEHYDAVLEDLWGDEHEAAALSGLRRFLDATSTGRRNYQRRSATASCRVFSARHTAPSRKPSARPPSRCSRHRIIRSISRLMTSIPSVDASALAAITTRWRLRPWMISRRSRPISASCATATARSS